MQQDVIPRRPQDKTNNKMGASGHNENNLDPMIRMEFWGQLGLKRKSEAQLVELGRKTEAGQQSSLA